MSKMLKTEKLHQNRSKQLASTAKNRAYPETDIIFDIGAHDSSAVAGVVQGWLVPLLIRDFLTEQASAATKLGSEAEKNFSTTESNCEEAG